MDILRATRDEDFGCVGLKSLGNMDAGSYDHPIIRLRKLLKMNGRCSVNLIFLCMILVPAIVLARERNAASQTKHDQNRNLVFEIEQNSAVEAFLFTTADIPFRVKNVGEKAIRILDVEPRKGSGGGRADPALLQPGAEGKLVVTRQVTSLGLSRVAFRIRTDEKTDPDYTLNARLFGISAYTPDLPGVDFEVVRAGRAVEKQISIASYEGSQLDLKAVLESPPWLEIKAVPRAPGESSQSLVINARLLGSAPKGLLQGSVHLLTSVEAQPDLVLPIQARIFDSVSVSPMPATLKPAHVGETRNVVVEYRSLDGKVLKLESVADSTGALKLTPMPCGVGCAKVDAELKATRAGEFGGVITARFATLDEPLEVHWDILVVTPETKLIDLGVIDEESVDSSDDTSVRAGEQP